MRNRASRVLSLLSFFLKVEHASLISPSRETQRHTFREQGGGGDEMRTVRKPSWNFPSPPGIFSKLFAIPSPGLPVYPMDLPAASSSNRVLQFFYAKGNLHHVRQRRRRGRGGFVVQGRRPRCSPPPRCSPLSLGRPPRHLGYLE